MIVTDKYGDLQLEYTEKIQENDDNQTKKIIIPADIYNWWNSLSENPLKNVVIYSYEVPITGIGYEIIQRIIISPEGIDNIPVNVINPNILKINETIDDNGQLAHYIITNDKIDVKSSEIKFIVKVTEYDPIIRNPGLVYSDELIIN